MKTALRPCPICGQREVEVLHHQRFVLPEGNILPSSFDVVWCPVCGLAYADTSATQEDYDRYYAEFSKYEDNKTSTGGGGSGWDARRLRETAEAIAELVGDRALRIVDIGCANGGLLAELHTLGFQHLLGVDPSSACVANCEKIGIAARVGSIRQMPAGTGKFDLIILSHVLEHVADLSATVRDLEALLSARGRLYIEVPDAARYREFLAAPFQDFNTEHINHFGLAALRNLFEEHGFTLEASGQKNIESSPGCPYPAAFAFFRRDEKTTLRAGSHFEIDEAFRRNLLGYIEASREQLNQIEERIAPFCDGTTELMVWGTGQLTMKLLAETCLGRARISAFIDGNPVNQGKRLRGVPIIAPTEITDRESPIVIATLLHEKAITENIRQTLRLPNRLITLGG